MLSDREFPARTRIRRTEYVCRARVPSLSSVARRGAEAGAEGGVLVDTTLQLESVGGSESA
jgi:hypothetical protein